MKILHTADLHLKNYGDERWEALKEILEIGKREKIDILAIAGDLFDKEVFSQQLRPKIRNLFSLYPFQIVILPGNHDKEAFEEGWDFGENTKILRDIDCPYENEKLRIFGLPFSYQNEKEILEKLYYLNTKIKTDKKNILLYHGELLDSSFSSEDFGNEEKRYMPAKLSYFKELKIDYVLAGHFHTHFDLRKISEKKYFVYPGSPISITKKELGKRKVNLFELGGPPREYLLNTPYYQERLIEIFPENENPIEKVKEELEKILPFEKTILILRGFIDSKLIKKTEVDLRKEIAKKFFEKCKKCKKEDFIFEVQDISKIMEDEIFREFIKKLKEKNLPKQKEKEIFEIGVKVMMEICK